MVYYVISEVVHSHASSKRYECWPHAVLLSFIDPQNAGQQLRSILFVFSLTFLCTCWRSTTEANFSFLQQNIKLILLIILILIIVIYIISACICGPTWKKCWRWRYTGQRSSQARELIVYGTLWKGTVWMQDGLVGCAKYGWLLSSLLPPGNVYLWDTSRWGLLRLMRTGVGMGCAISARCCWRCAPRI